jgi:hypothetical protein
LGVGELNIIGIIKPTKLWYSTIISLIINFMEQSTPSHNNPSESASENSEDSLILEANRRFLERQIICEDSGEWISTEYSKQSKLPKEIQEGEVLGCMSCGS